MTTPTAANGPDWIDETLAGYPPLLTVQEAMGVIRTSRRNFSRLLADGRIKSVRAAEGGSSRHLIPRSELARYLRALA